MQIVKALFHCIYLNGDLHGGRFHTLLAIVYTTHFGGFIQTFQVAFSVKHISATKKVEEYYLQCEGLVLKIFYGCERQAYDAFIHGFTKDEITV